MPKIYEYFGIIFYIYTFDHKPIHIHAKYGNYEMKVELIYIAGKLDEVVLRKVKGKDILPDAKCKDVVKFVNKYHKTIVSKWEDVMILNKKPRFSKITKKI